MGKTGEVKTGESVTGDTTTAITVWRIDGTEFGSVTSESKAVSTLTIRVRATTSEVETGLRPLKSDEGKVAVLNQDDGGYVAVDRADGANTIAIQPPDRREPLRQTKEYHVVRYEESLVSQTVDEWTVDLVLVETDDRTDVPSIAQSPATDEWGFVTRFGEIATPRVDAEVLGTGAEGVERFELTARLTFDQAHVFEAALSRLQASRVRTIPDQPNELVDDTDGTKNTLTIDTPDGNSVIADGDFVVTGWTSTRLSDARQSIQFTIGKT